MANVIGIWLLQCILAGDVMSWINEYDRPFTFTCPLGTSLNHVFSVHDNSKHDRVWDFSCLAPTQNDLEMIDCKWSEYENDFGKPLSYQCPWDGVIAGISSYHDTDHEDRRFKFYCCEVPDLLTGSCYFTPYVNDWDGHMEFVVPKGKIMRGWSSYRDNHTKDRRTKFEICDAFPLSPVG